MKYYIVCVRDIVADVFHPPIFSPNLGGAIRSFGDACVTKTEGNVIGQHPDDYELYELGTWDDQSAEFTPTTPRKQIAVGKNYNQR